VEYVGVGEEQPVVVAYRVALGLGGVSVEGLDAEAWAAGGGKTAEAGELVLG
jgi:hypothetical protein